MLGITMRLEPAVKLYFLGSAALEMDGTMIRQFRWSKVPELLAYLAVHPGENARETVAETLWPDRNQENSRQNLRQTLLYVDRLLQPKTEKILRVTRQTLEFRPTAVGCDIDPYLGQNATREEVGNSISRDERLIEQYCGPFLATLSEEWIVEVRARIARVYFEALASLSLALLPTDPARSLVLADSAIKEEPYEDLARVAKIKALKSLGREASAKQEFEAYSQLLDQYLGFAPGRSVTEALRGDVTPSRQRVSTSLEGLASGDESGAQILSFLQEQSMGREAADLALALVPFWIRKGTPALGRRLLTEAIEASRRPFSATEKLSLANLLFTEGDNSEARKLLADLGAADTSPAIEIDRLLLEATIDLREVKPRAALRAAVVALRLARASLNFHQELEGWKILALARFELSQYKRVEQPAAKAHRLTARLNDEVNRQLISTYRAFSLLRLGDGGEASRIAQELRSELKPGNTPILVQIKSSLGRLLEELGLRDEAASVYEECVVDNRSMGRVFSVNIALTYLGDLETERGNLDAALRYHLEALKSRRELDQNLGVATSLRGIGRVLLAKGQASEARSSLQESAQRYRDELATSGHASALLLLAEAEFSCGNGALAKRLGETAVDILRGLSPSVRLTIGPSGAGILERGEALLGELNCAGS